MTGNLSARAIQDIVHISKKVERGVPTRLFQVFHLSASGRRAPPMEALSLRLSVHNKFKCSSRAAHRPLATHLVSMANGHEGLKYRSLFKASVHVAHISHWIMMGLISFCAWFDQTEKANELRARSLINVNYS
jgi:hypothetical protein